MGILQNKTAKTKLKMRHHAVDNFRIAKAKALAKEKKPTLIFKKNYNPYDMPPMINGPMAPVLTSAP